MILPRVSAKDRDIDSGSVTGPGRTTTNELEFPDHPVIAPLQHLPQTTVSTIPKQVVDAGSQGIGKLFFTRRER